MSAGNPPSWALTAAVIAEQQLQIHPCNITAVFGELNPAIPPTAQASKTESQCVHKELIDQQRLQPAEESEGFMEQRGYLSSAERVSEQLYGTAQLRVGQIGWEWQRKKGKEKLGCHKDSW